jgi:hypothetical protein
LKITHLKQLLTFSVLLFSFSSFGQNFPTVIDSLICRLSGNHSVVHLVGEDAIEKTYFFDSLGKNTLIKSVNFLVSEDTLNKVNLTSRQTHRLYKTLDFPEIIKFDSINHIEKHIKIYSENKENLRETILFNEVYSRISEDTSILNIIKKYRTQSYYYLNDSIVKYIDSFKLFKSDSMLKPFRVVQNVFHLKISNQVLYIVSEQHTKCYTIDLENMILKEHSMSYANDKDISTKFDLLKEVYERDYHINSYQINFYNSKEEIPILSKKKRLKQYKKFHKSFPSNIQLR